MPKLNSSLPVQPLRRQFVKLVAGASVLAMSPPVTGATGMEADSLPEAFAHLKPLGARVHPITADEYRERLERAQKWMSELKPGYDALFVAPGTSLYYFTGIRWVMSERLLALVLPR